MSKHSVPGGDFAGLMERFAQLQEKARLRTGQSFRIIVVQEAGLDGFWIHRALQNEGIESHVVDAASIATSRRRRRAKTDKIDGETLVRALLAYKRGEPRVCAMVKAPTPGEEDRRHLCRERKALTAERVRHVNRIKGLLFSQGISASGWKNSKPATAAPSLSILKRSSTVSSIGLNFFSNRSRPWRPRGTRCWLWDKRPSPRRQRCYLT
jgi:transposase